MPVSRDNATSLYRQIAARLRDEMAGPAERGSVFPLGRETELLELGLQHATDLAHAGKVERATVDIDDPLEERFRLGVVRIDESHHRLLRRTHRRGALGSEWGWEKEQRSEGEPPAGQMDRSRVERSETYLESVSSRFDHDLLAPAI